MYTIFWVPLLRLLLTILNFLLFGLNFYLVFLGIERLGEVVKNKYKIDISDGWLPYITYLVICLQFVMVIFWFTEVNKTINLLIHP